MNSNQLDRILGKNYYTKKYFKGVYSSNNIPTYKIFPHCFVANTDKKGTFGEHWVGFFIKDDKNAEYFDSYGEDPNRDITKFLSNFSKVNLNNRSIQSPFSDSCGHYCVYYIYNKCKGISFIEIIKNLLSSKTSDSLVKYFVKFLTKK